VGNLTSLTDARDQTTIFTYEDRNLVATTRNALGETKTYFYDAARMLDHVIDAKGQRIEFAYDDSGQLKRKVLKSSTGTVTDTVNYGYDLHGNLTSASDSDSALSFTYDPLDRLSTPSTTAAPAQPATTVSYTHDKAATCTRMTDPHGNPTTYTYDTLNQLATLTSPDGAFMFGHDDAGRRTSLQFPNGIRAIYAYSPASQLTSLHYLDSTLTMVSKFDYTHDDKGSRDSRTTLDGTTAYTYDSQDRLTGAVGPNPTNPTEVLTESYSYDAVGNRTSSQSATGQVHDAANRLQEDSRSTYHYDLNGNLTSRLDKATNEPTTYDWDVENRLVAVHNPAQTVTFRYDPLGRRIEKAGSTTTRYIYDQEDIVEELDGNNGLRLRYTHGPGIDEPLARREAATSTVTYYQADGLGSITDTSNATGQAGSLVNRYDSYGKVLVGAATGGYAFTGREGNDESGVYYYRARYYDAQSGRFISEDPIGFGGGINFYSYVHNSPTNLVDPLGLLDSASPWQVGWEWLTGSGKRTHHFSDGDPFTELLRQHQHIQDLIHGVCNGTLSQRGRFDYSLTGLQGVPKYLNDYSTLFSGGLTGNLAATYLGSYKLEYSVTNGTLNIQVENSSSIASALRPPVIGYTEWWSQNIGGPLNDFFSSGPLSATQQFFVFHENLNCNCK